MEQTTEADLMCNVTDIDSSKQYPEMPIWYVVGCSIMCLLGIAGNSITLIVLFRRKLWTSVNVLIGIMSISDLLVLPIIASIPLQVYFNKMIYESTSYLQDALTTSSCLCAMIIGCERSFAVRSPLKFREMWNTRLTVKLYVVGYAVGILFVVLRTLVIEIINVEFFETYIYIPYFVVIRGIPFIFILVTNILLILGLIQNSKLVNSISSQNNEKERVKTETAITRMVVGVTSVYFLCMVPSRISSGLMHAGVFTDENLIVYFLTTALEILNFSFNIIIYTVTSKFFRHEYGRLFSCCLCCLQTSVVESTSIELNKI